ncbi:MAG TPA: class I SAM-dependent methyltransferase, partial [Chitinophaga sp.]
QGPLWGRSAGHWARIQEPTGRPGYVHALDYLGDLTGKSLLDVGCGTGLFCVLASEAGAWVTGLDASEAFIDFARHRDHPIHFLTGELEELPFPDGSFDVVTGFNSFQYAADVAHAFREAKRVLKDDGVLVVMIWGNQQDCEAATYLQAVGTLLPPPPPGAGGPFALSEHQLLQQQLQAAGWQLLTEQDVDAVWDYADRQRALQGLMAAGPVARAIDHSGEEKAAAVINEALQPYIQANGHVVYKNKFRVVIAQKAQ